MAALPFHYFLALREDWIESNREPADEDDGLERDADGNVIDFNAESFKGEAV